MITITRDYLLHPPPLPINHPYRRADSVAGEGKLDGYYNFLIGKQSDWRTFVPQFHRLRYSDVHPGVDVVVHEGRGLFKYDVRLAPKSDLSRFVIRRPTLGDSIPGFLAT